MGMLIWHTAIFGVLLLAGSVGVFEDEPTLALGLIGGAIVLGILYWFQHLEKTAGNSPPSVEKPAKQPKYTPPPRPKPLTAEQSKAMNLKEHISERTYQFRDKPSKPSKKPTVTSEPTRAIREGWALCSIAFDYEDATGAWTERTVTVHSVNRVHFKGECHDKHAERTFRLDRVMSDIADIDTGEILDVDEWVKLYA